MITDLDGGCPSVHVQHSAERVSATDAYGRTQIDSIYQGGNWSAEFVCIEWRAGSIAALWPFGTFGVLGVIGRLKWSLASALVLTSIAGTPAATLGPATITATKAIITDGFDSRILFGPTLRKVPVRMDLLPFSSGGNICFITTT